MRGTERWVWLAAAVLTQKGCSRRALCVFAYVCVCVCVCAHVCACLSLRLPRTRLPGVNWNNRGAESETEPEGIRCDRVSARPSKQMQAYLPLSASLSFFSGALPRSLKDCVSPRAERTGPLRRLASSKIETPETCSHFHNQPAHLSPGQLVSLDLLRPCKGRKLQPSYGMYYFSNSSSASSLLSTSTAAGPKGKVFNWAFDSQLESRRRLYQLVVQLRGTALETH